MKAPLRATLGLLAATAFDVPVDGVVTGIQASAREPAVGQVILFVEDLVPGLLPIDALRGFAPEFFRRLDRGAMYVAIVAHDSPACNQPATSLESRGPTGHWTKDE